MTPEELRSCGLSKQKTGYILDLAEKVALRQVNFRKLALLSDEEVIEHLTQVKGVGVWTVQMFLMFALWSGRMCFHMPIWACGTPSTARTTYPKRRSRQTCCESASPGIHIVRLRRGTCGEVWREPRESDLSAELHQFRVGKKTRFFRCAIQIEKARIEQTSGFDFTHCRKQRLFQMRMIALQFGKDIAQRPANCPRFCEQPHGMTGAPRRSAKARVRSSVT